MILNPGMKKIVLVIFSLLDQVMRARQRFLIVVYRLSPPTETYFAGCSDIDGM